ncbi:MAG: hypothetical protein HYZ37_00780 [Candidatus Solibacter usitatus]|nr:hypothetical protein [Candidatus Solibacter usitatus]
MTLTIELPKDVEAALKPEAQAHGVTLEVWLQKIAMERARPAGQMRSLQDDVTPEEWIRQFHEWAGSHDRTTPLLSDEAISRESIYPDRT